MMDRFYTSDALDQPTVELVGPEAHHLLHVLRKTAGDEVRLFDGRGAEAAAVVEATGKRTARLRVTESVRQDAPSSRRLVVASAVPKGHRAGWLVEKLTELGVAQWTPLSTQRSVVSPRPAKLEKLRHTVIAACKQCGRNRLMQIASPRPWTGFLRDRAASRTLLVCETSGKPLHAVFEAATETQEIAVAVGPEGGFTSDELRAAESCGANFVSLSEFVLRIETAAVAAAAAVRMLRRQNRNADSGVLD